MLVLEIYLALRQTLRAQAIYCVNVIHEGAASNKEDIRLQ
jgi:hypothetical protein